MAIDPMHHAIDKDTGFAIDTGNGHIVGMAPAPLKRLTDETDWPKWVTPDASHIHRGDNGHVSVPLFPEFFIDRATKAVSVLVKNEDEEKLALAPKQTLAPKQEPDVVTDDASVAEDSSAQQS